MSTERFTTLRELRRRPARSAATVVVLALSLAALGVLAVPSISSAVLDDLAERDAMAHITLQVTPIEDPSLADGGLLSSIPGVTAAETRTETATIGPDGSAVTVVGIDARAQSVNVVSAIEGRLPTAPGEALVTPALAEAGHAVGETLEGPAGALSVVGVGNTASFDAEPAVVVDGDVLTAPNTVLLRLEDPTEAALDSTVSDVRALLAEHGVTLTGFPELNIDGAHPLAQEISMVAVMIGMLGVVAGIVALVLLASTTAAIIADRSAEVAVLRAMGSGPRATRRRLRRIAMTTAALAAVVGIPLGLAVANLMSRMVLERFAAVTPGFGISVPLVAGSLAFLLLGARLVSAPAARRLVSRPLASALRDSDGRPFGDRWYQRSAARLPAAVRAPFARPGRTLGLTLQAAAAVATVLVVASLGTSLAQFAEHELEPWRYEEVARPVNPGDGWQTSRGDDQLGAANGEEAGLFAQGSFGDFDIDVYGTLATTEVIDRTVVEGRWFRSGAATPEAVVTDGFARHRGIGVGDAVELELPSGPAEVVVVGTHRLRSAAFFVERAALGDMLGRSDTADVLWVMGRPGPMSEFVSSSHMVEVERPADLVEEDRAARSMIMGIFWAIGIVVATVAAIGFASSLQMMVHDRRRELAAVRAGGASSGLLRRLVLSEAMWVAVVGAALGAVAAHFGASALMAFVESGESMDIGYAYATHMLAPVVAAALAGVALLSVLAVRPVVRCGAGILLR